MCVTVYDPNRIALLSLINCGKLRCVIGPDGDGGSQTVINSVSRREKAHRRSPAQTVTIRLLCPPHRINLGTYGTHGKSRHPRFVRVSGGVSSGTSDAPSGHLPSPRQ
eukprot:1395206-Amorphochlora_amoeboformis.AAC.2